MSKEEMISLFSLDKVHKAGARFDFDKAKWFNHQYLKARPDEELANRLKDQLGARGYPFAFEYVREFCRLMKERATFINDLPDLGYYFFEDIKKFDREIIQKKYDKNKRPQFDLLIQAIDSVSEFTSEAVEAAIKDFAQANSIKAGELMPVFRLALAGTMQGPPVFEMMHLLGKERSIMRLKKSFDYFDSF
jgi:glutamyl-tRNA synthetase